MPLISVAGLLAGLLAGPLTGLLSEPLAGISDGIAGLDGELLAGALVLWGAGTCVASAGCGSADGDVPGAIFGLAVGRDARCLKRLKNERNSRNTVRSPT